MTDPDYPDPSLIARAIALSPDPQPDTIGPPTVERREPKYDSTMPKCRKPGEPRRPPTERELAIREEISRYERSLPTPCGARCGRWVAWDLTTLYRGHTRLCPACLEAALIAEREAVRIAERARERRRTLAERAVRWAELEMAVGRINCPNEVP